MHYSNSDEFVLESERSINKELYISYDIKSMASDCLLLDDLVSRLFIACEISQLNTVKASTKRQIADERLKRNLRSVVWHLFKAQRRSRDFYVRIPLSNGAFTGRAEGNPFKISREVRDIIHLLDKHGFIQKHIGFLDVTSKHTRVRATLELLSELRTLPVALKEEHVERQSVIFRKKVKSKRTYFSKKQAKDVTVYETRNVEIPKPFAHQSFDRAHTIVSSFNNALKNHEIDISPDIRDHFTLDEIGDGMQMVDFGDASLRAIFHVADDNTVTYGRMHGGWWQMLRSKFRRFITIDGTPTIELDYSAQALNMAASHSKVQLIGDPYAVDLGVSFLDAESERKIVKSCIVIMLNTKSKVAAMHAVMGKVEEDELWRTDVMEIDRDIIYSFFDCIFEHHPFLRRYAFKELGMMFFFHDSEVARRIIEIFNGFGKVILPIHDGFIAKSEDADLIRKAMEDAWAEKFGTTIGIKME